MGSEMCIRDRLSHLLLLLSLLLDSVEQHGLLGVLDVDVVLALVVLHEGRLLASVVGERGAGVSVEVDVVDLVALVVVAGEDDSAYESLLSVGVEVVLALFVEIHQEISDCLSPEDAMGDIAAEHDAVLVLLHRSHVARPHLQLVLGDHVAVARIVVVPVHLAHLESVHDSVEEDVVELDTVPVPHSLVMLQVDGQGHRGAIIGMVGVELGAIL